MRVSLLGLLAIAFALAQAPPAAREPNPKAEVSTAAKSAKAKAVAGRGGAVSKAAVADKPNIVMLPPGQRPDVSLAPKTPATAQRDLEPDGTVVIPLPDGSVKRILPNGGIEIRHADGTVDTYIVSRVMVQSPPNLPPAEPGSNLGSWLKSSNDELLEVIRGIVRTKSSVDAYVASEKGQTDYWIFDHRLELLGKLVKP